ncbi:hypothetical protein GCM10023169_10900 [Georgenia halophila]|uniref:Lysyl-tRNA synthetase n=1 Tax=Georgenia halophila TaxID=620889 RepID=A0ABP8L1I9_9MICO
MDHLVALVPSIGTGILFYLAIRAIVNADRKERDAERRLAHESAANNTDRPIAGE